MVVCEDGHCSAINELPSADSSSIQLVPDNLGCSPCFKRHAFSKVVPDEIEGLVLLGLCECASPSQFKKKCCPLLCFWQKFLCWVPFFKMPKILISSHVLYFGEVLAWLRLLLTKLWDASNANFYVEVNCLPKCGADRRSFIHLHCSHKCWRCSHKCWRWWPYIFLPIVLFGFPLPVVSRSTTHRCNASHTKCNIPTNVWMSMRFDNLNCTCHLLN